MLNWTSMDLGRNREGFRKIFCVFFVFWGFVTFFWLEII